MMRQTSSSMMSYSVTSGSAMTPTVAAAWSPIERAIARPRKLCHTREGEPLAPAGVTCPPRARMRFISAGVSGFWSTVRSWAMSLFVLAFRLHMTTRESPELANHMWLPRIRHTTAVVPDTEASTWSARDVSTLINVRRRASPGSALKEGCAASSSGRVSMTYCETFSPARPCPSKTPPRKEALSPAKGYLATARS
eukprot:scaffold27835_cov122-Isochrysis_galbana.AAC.5